MDGKLKWEAQQSRCAIVQPIIVNNTIVYAEFSGAGRFTNALDALDGRTIWNYKNGGHTFGLVSNENVIVHSSVPKKIVHDYRITIVLIIKVIYQIIHWQ